MSDLFDLLPDDVEYLDAHYLDQWRKINEGNGKFGLLIEKFPIPKGLAPTVSDLMLLVPVGYPASPLDMFYFDPPITRTNRGNISALAIEQHFGREWQRWSRHYPWVPGQDNMVGHIQYVSEELQRESSG